MARNYYWNYVTRGDALGVTGAGGALTPFQGSYPNATVRVDQIGTSTLASIYATSGGAAKPNPFTASDAGFFDFWADAGSVKLTFSGGGLPGAITIDNVSLGGAGGVGTSGYVSVTDSPFNADVSGVTDATAAIQATIAAYPAGNVTILIPGAPLVTETLNISGRFTRIVQTGAAIKFVPSAACIAAGGVLYNFSSGASVLYGCGLYNGAAWSPNRTDRKVLCRLTDISRFTCVNLSSGRDGLNDDWTGSNSVGLWLRGRETSCFYGTRLGCDMPIYIDKNPNSATLEDVDHFSFYDTDLVVLGAANYGITCADGIHWSNTNFHNGNVSLGAGIIYWHNTVGAGIANHDLKFSGTWRHEQTTAAASPAVHLFCSNGYLQSAVLDGIEVGGAKGFYLRGAGAPDGEIVLRNCKITLGGGLALDFDGATLDLDNVYCAPTSTVSFANMTQTRGDTGQANEPVAHHARYVPNTNGLLLFGIMEVFGGVRRFPQRGTLTSGSQIALAPFQSVQVVGAVRVVATGATKTAQITAAVDQKGAIGSVAADGEIVIAPSTPAVGKFALWFQGAGVVTLYNNSGESMSYLVMVDWV